MIRLNYLPVALLLARTVLVLAILFGLAYFPFQGGTPITYFQEGVKLGEENRERVLETPTSPFEKNPEETGRLAENEETSFDREL